MTLAEAEKFLCVHYVRRINAEVVAKICQDREDPQFLSLLLVDERNGRWILLRLSTFREVMRFVVAKGFEKARRLTWFEKWRNALR